MTATLSSTGTKPVQFRKISLLFLGIFDVQETVAVRSVFLVQVWVLLTQCRVISMQSVAFFLFFQVWPCVLSSLKWRVLVTIMTSLSFTNRAPDRQEGALPPPFGVRAYADLKCAWARNAVRWRVVVLFALCFGAECRVGVLCCSSLVSQL